jgi:hypothetical protein
MRNALVSKVLIAAGLLTFTVLYSEFFIRIFDPQAIMPRYVTGTPYGVRGNIPNARYQHTTPEVDVAFRINSQGMRADHDYALTKPPGTCRIALFGDSFFMGYELNYEKTFARLLEQRLQDRGYRLEVLNFAVSGFGTSEMLRAYENFGRQFDPDVVLFQWHATDLDDNVRADLYRWREGKLLATGSSYLPSIAIQDRLMQSWLYRLVADHSHLYSVAREPIARKTKKILAAIRRSRRSATAPPQEALAADEDEGGTPDRDLSPYGIALSNAVLKLSKDTVEADGHRFFLVEIPARVSRAVFRPSTAELDLRDIDVITPLDGLRKAASLERKLYFEQGHGHMTPEAIEILTSTAVERLLAQSKFESCETLNEAGREP